MYTLLLEGVLHVDYNYLMWYQLIIRQLCIMFNVLVSGESE